MKTLNKNHKYTTILLLFFVLPVSAWGVDDENSRKSLIGITGVGVTVGYLSPDLQKVGLTKERIQTEAEIRLGHTRINVLSKDDLIGASDSPMLIIFPNILTFTSDRFAYNVTIKLIQKVYLERNKEYISSETWSSSSVGLSSDVNDLIGSIEHHTNKFTRAWLLANPE